MQFTEAEKHFVSEDKEDQWSAQLTDRPTNGDHNLKSYDLITSPAYVVQSVADDFRDKAIRPNQLWQTNRT